MAGGVRTSNSQPWNWQWYNVDATGIAPGKQLFTWVESGRIILQNALFLAVEMPSLGAEHT